MTIGIPHSKKVTIIPSKEIVNHLSLILLITKVIYPKILRMK